MTNGTRCRIVTARTICISAFPTDFLPSPDCGSEDFDPGHGLLVAFRCEVMSVLKTESKAFELQGLSEVAEWLDGHTPLSGGATWRCFHVDSP